MPVRNQLVELVQQLRQLERLLLAGATTAELMASVSLSDRQVRRLIAQLRILGLTIESDHTPGSTESATLKAKKLTRIFR